MTAVEREWSQWSGNAERPARRGLFFSGRFDGLFKELVIREVARMVRAKAPFLEVLIVDESNTREPGYGAATATHLHMMDCIVPFVFIDYGQFTGSPCSTFDEVRYCLQHQDEVRCIPLKLYDSKLWPPIPNDCDDPKSGTKGASQNRSFFSKELPYREFPLRTVVELEARKAEMADYIIGKYMRLNPAPGSAHVERVVTFRSPAVTQELEEDDEDPPSPLAWKPTSPLGRKAPLFDRNCCGSLWDTAWAKAGKFTVQAGEKFTTEAEKFAPPWLLHDLFACAAAGEELGKKAAGQGQQRPRPAPLGEEAVLGRR